MEIQVTSIKRGQNACERVAIGFGLTSHLLRKWRELIYPIREQSKAKPEQTCRTNRIVEHENTRTRTVGFNERERFASALVLNIKG